MSKNTILPEGMSWFYNPQSDTFSLIVSEECKYQNIDIEKRSKINSETSHNNDFKKVCSREDCYRGRLYDRWMRCIGDCPVCHSKPISKS